MAKPEKMNVRSYAVAPDVRGSPRLTIMTDKQTMRVDKKQEITSFLEAVFPGIPCKVQKTKRETPTGGEFYYFERID